MAPGPGPATVARHWCGLMPASVVAKWSQHLYPDTKSVTTTSTSTLDVSSIVVIVLQAVVRQTCVRIFVDILYIFVDNIFKELIQSMQLLRSVIKKNVFNP